MSSAEECTSSFQVHFISGGLRGALLLLRDTGQVVQVWAGPRVLPGPCHAPDEQFELFNQAQMDSAGTGLTLINTKGTNSFPPKQSCCFHPRPRRVCVFISSSQPIRGGAGLPAETETKLPIRGVGQSAG